MYLIFFLKQKIYASNILWLETLAHIKMEKQNLHLCEALSDFQKKSYTYTYKYNTCNTNI